MATKKTPGRKVPAKKVAAVHRLREHKAKKRPEPAHVFEDMPPTQPEFDFTSLGQAKQAADPGPVYCGAELGKIDKPYRPEEPQYEGRDNTVPSDIEINLGRCHIWLRFR